MHSALAFCRRHPFLAFQSCRGGGGAHRVQAQDCSPDSSHSSLHQSLPSPGVRERDEEEVEGDAPAPANDDTQNSSPAISDGSSESEQEERISHRLTRHRVNRRFYIPGTSMTTTSLLVTIDAPSQSEYVVYLGAGSPREGSLETALAEQG